jgi:hypothetical protein
VSKTLIEWKAFIAVQCACRFLQQQKNETDMIMLEHKIKNKNEKL